MFPSQRVLIVADDSDQRSLFSLFLTRAGYPIAAVSDGEDALVQLSREHFDLLLTDYFLPGIFGDQLIDEVRHAGYPIKTVLMSNHIDVNSIARACHADGYFRKEDCHQLILLIKKLLDTAQLSKV